MEKRSMGATIVGLRKEKGMTQANLAGRLGVTDKAVSKWERDLSCPDIGTIPKLAEELGVSVEELMHAAPLPGRKEDVVLLVCKAVALAMGAAAAVLSAMGRLEAREGMFLLGLGLACVGVVLLKTK